MNIPKEFDGQTRKISFGVPLHLSDDATAVQFEKNILSFMTEGFWTGPELTMLYFFPHRSGTLGLVPDIRMKAQIQRLSPPVAEVVINNNKNNKTELSGLWKK